METNYQLKVGRDLSPNFPLLDLAKGCMGLRRKDAHDAALARVAQLEASLLVINGATQFVKDVSDDKPASYNDLELRASERACDALVGACLHDALKGPPLVSIVLLYMYRDTTVVD